MTNKDIEKAAERSTEEYVENGDLRGFRGSYRLGFIAGADWRINSVWHDVEESPKQGSLIAVFDGKDMHLWRAEDMVNVINGIRVVSMTVKECFIRQHIIKWAYIKDLIPNKED